MGKEQEEQPVSNKQSTQTHTKKIVKRVMFKPNKSKGDDDLKEWKPIKISETVEQQKKQIQKEKVDIAHNFLSCLPKPQNQAIKEAKLSFEQKNYMRASIKPAKKLQLTEEQRKWDVEDQSFIKTEFKQPATGQIEHELVEQDEDEVEVDRIKWLNEPQSKVKEVDLTKVIDKNWQQSVKKRDFQSEIWDSGLAKGKGQLSEFVRDAMKRFDEDEDAINKQHLNKKRMRSRYGW